MTQQPPPPPPPGQPYYPQPPAQESSSKAVVALVLGILSFVLCGPFTAIPAIFVGRSAIKEIDASQGRLDGRGMAQAGFVLGLVGTVLALLAVVAVIGLVVLGATTGSFDDHCTRVGNDGGFTANCTYP